MNPLKHESPDQYKFFLLKIPIEDQKQYFYFKRLPSQFSSVDSDLSLYQNLRSIVKADDNLEQKNCSVDKDFPVDRTLLVINMDQPMNEQLLKQVFRINGKLRRVYKGNMKFKGQKVYVGVIIFTREFDLTKCFEIEHFQKKVYEKFKKQENQSDRWKLDLLEKYEQKDPEKDQLIQEAQEDGFQIVTDKFGDFSVDPMKNEEMLMKKQTRRKKKAKSNHDLFNMKQDDDEGEAQSGEDLLKLRKQKLLRKFEEDKEELQKRKKVKQE